MSNRIGNKQQVDENMFYENYIKPSRFNNLWSCSNKKISEGIFELLEHYKPTKNNGCCGVKKIILEAGKPVTVVVHKRKQEGKK